MILSTVHESGEPQLSAGLVIDCVVFPGSGPRSTVLFFMPDSKPVRSAASFWKTDDGGQGGWGKANVYWCDPATGLALAHIPVRLPKVSSSVSSTSPNEVELFVPVWGEPLVDEAGSGESAGSSRHAFPYLAARLESVQLNWKARESGKEERVVALNLAKKIASPSASSVLGLLGQTDKSSVTDWAPLSTVLTAGEPKILGTNVWFASRDAAIHCEVAFWPGSNADIDWRLLISDGLSFEHMQPDEAGRRLLLQPSRGALNSHQRFPDIQENQTRSFSAQLAYRRDNQWQRFAPFSFSVTRVLSGYDYKWQAAEGIEFGQPFSTENTREEFVSPSQSRRLETASPVTAVAPAAEGRYFIVCEEGSPGFRVADIVEGKWLASPESTRSGTLQVAGNADTVFALDVTSRRLTAFSLPGLEEIASKDLSELGEPLGIGAGCGSQTAPVVVVTRACLAVLDPKTLSFRGLPIDTGRLEIVQTRPGVMSWNPPRSSKVERARVLASGQGDIFCMATLPWRTEEGQPLSESWLLEQVSGGWSLAGGRSNSTPAWSSAFFSEGEMVRRNGVGFAQVKVTNERYLPFIQTLGAGAVVAQVGNRPVVPPDPPIFRYFPEIGKPALFAFSGAGAAGEAYFKNPGSQDPTRRFQAWYLPSQFLLVSVDQAGVLAERFAPPALRPHFVSEPLPAFAGTPWSFDTRNSHQPDLTWTLQSAPAGATMDDEGILRWTPPAQPRDPSVRFTLVASVPGPPVTLDVPLRRGAQALMSRDSATEGEPLAETSVAISGSVLHLIPANDGEDLLVQSRHESRLSALSLSGAPAIRVTRKIPSGRALVAAPPGHVLIWYPDQNVIEDRDPETLEVVKTIPATETEPPVVLAAGCAANAGPPVAIFASERPGATSRALGPLEFRDLDPRALQLGNIRETENRLSRPGVMFYSQDFLPSVSAYTGLIALGEALYDRSGASSWAPVRPQSLHGTGNWYVSGGGTYAVNEKSRWMRGETSVQSATDIKNVVFLVPDFADGAPGAVVRSEGKFAFLLLNEKTLGEKARIDPLAEWNQPAIQYELNVSPQDVHYDSAKKVLVTVARDGLRLLVRKLPDR